MNTLPALDLEVFDELHEGVRQQPATVASLYDTFFDNAVRLISTLRTTDSGAVREKTLHALKGSAAMMGAARVARRATDLQHTCATMDGDALRDSIHELDADLETTREAVHARLASLGPSGPRH